MLRTESGREAIIHKGRIDHPAETASAEKYLPRVPLPPPVGLNEDAFLALNGAGNPALDPVMIALGVLGLSYFTFLWAVPLWVAKRRVEALDILVLLAVAEIAVFLLKVALAVDRPAIGVRLVVPLDDASDPAFPSGHTTRAFALAMLLALRTRDWRWGAPLFSYATAVGLSRIYVGVHWPSDVVGGALLGVAWAVAFERISRTARYSRIRGRVLARLGGPPA